MWPKGAIIRIPPEANWRLKCYGKLQDRQAPFEVLCRSSVPSITIKRVRPASHNMGAHELPIYKLIPIKSGFIDDGYLTSTAFFCRWPLCTRWRLNHRRKSSMRVVLMFALVFAQSVFGARPHNQNLTLERCLKRAMKEVFFKMICVQANIIRARQLTTRFCSIVHIVGSRVVRSKATPRFLSPSTLSAYNGS